MWGEIMANQSERPGFLIWFSQVRQVKMLTDEEAGILFKSIIEYAQNEKTPSPSNNRVIDIVFAAFKETIDQDKASYNEKRQRQSEGGKKSAALRYKAAEEKRREEEPQPTEQQHTTPTLTEIIKYCRDENLKIDGYKFFDYYSGQGWKKNGRLISDWRSLAQHWNDTEYNKSQHMRHILPEDDIMLQNADLVPTYK